MDLLAVRFALTSLGLYSHKLHKHVATTEVIAECILLKDKEFHMVCYVWCSLQESNLRLSL